MEHLNMQTPDGAQLNLDALYKLCPSCFTEGKDKDGNLTHKINWNKLRELLGDYAEENAPESYDFTWVGKRAAQREAAAPINKTLRPCPEESVDWENTQNLYIEGDNLEVLKLLQNSYMGKVKMIYIDPPYNTGNDFVYHDDFAVPFEAFDEQNINEEGKRYYTRNTESNGRFHSDWCCMMYARLMAARSLLSDDGVILISIDDCEGGNVTNLCNEIFGEKNKISSYIWNCSTAGGIRPKFTSKTHEYVFAYAKDIEKVPTLYAPLSGDAQKMYNERDSKGLYRCKEFVFKNASNNDNQKYWITCPDGSKVKPKAGYIYRFVPDTYQNALNDDLVVFKETKSSSTLIDECGKPAKWNMFIKKYFGDGLGCPSSTLPKDSVSMYNKGTQDVQDLFNGKRVFENVKPVSLIQYLARIYSSKEDIVLDFFSGSGTTAQSVMTLNQEDDLCRRFILVQIDEITDEKSDAHKEGFMTICDIAKERIRRAGAKIKAENPNVDTGFRVFKCDSSNMKDVYFHPNDYSQDLLAGLEDNIKEDRTDLDLLFDCMLRWGVELSLPLSQKKVGSCTIHNVNDGDLVACFDGKITEEVIDQIAAMNPLRVVFRDSSFEEASEKMNLFELFKQKCQWSEQEVKNNVRVI